MCPFTTSYKEVVASGTEGLVSTASLTLVTGNLLLPVLWEPATLGTNMRQGRGGDRGKGRGGGRESG